jgi:hypothetical protein
MKNKTFETPEGKVNVKALFAAIMAEPEGTRNKTPYVHEPEPEEEFDAEAYGDGDQYGAHDPDSPFYEEDSD